MPIFTLCREMFHKEGTKIFPLLQEFKNKYLNNDSRFDSVLQNQPVSGVTRNGKKYLLLYDISAAIFVLRKNQVSVTICGVAGEFSQIANELSSKYGIQALESNIVDVDPDLTKMITYIYMTYVAPPSPTPPQHPQPPKKAKPPKPPEKPEYKPSVPPPPSIPMEQEVEIREGEGEGEEEEEEQGQE